MYSNWTHQIETEVKGCGQDLKTRCGYLLYKVQMFCKIQSPQGLGKR